MYDLFVKCEKCRIETDADYFSIKSVLELACMTHKLDALLLSDDIQLWNYAYTISLIEYKTLVQYLPLFQRYTIDELTVSYPELDIFGYVTVYRGVHDKSEHYSEAYSWTLDLEVAKGFGTLYVLTARVYVMDILNYIHEYCEEEVIIHPNDLIDLRRLSNDRPIEASYFGNLWADD